MFGDRLEVDVADPAVDLVRASRRTHSARRALSVSGWRQPPVVGQEQVEVVEAEPLVGDAELRVRLGAETAKQLREVVELLELRRLLLRQVRVELVPPELATHPERSATPVVQVSVSPIVQVRCRRLLKMSFGPPNEKRSIVAARAADVVAEPRRRIAGVEERSPDSGRRRSRS